MRLLAALVAFVCLTLALPAHAAGMFDPKPFSVDTTLIGRPDPHQLTLVGLGPGGSQSSACAGLYLDLSLDGVQNSGQNCANQATIASYTSAPGWSYTAPTTTGTGQTGTDVIGTDGVV